MRYRPLGRSGLVVSVVGLGLNNVGRSMDAAGTRKTLDAALDAGVTLLDTADCYGRHPASPRRSSARCSAPTGSGSCWPPSSAAT